MAVVLEAVVHLVEVAEATVVARLDENYKIRYVTKDDKFLSEGDRVKIEFKPTEENFNEDFFEYSNNGLYDEEGVFRLFEDCFQKIGDYDFTQNDVEEMFCAMQEALDLAKAEYNKKFEEKSKAEKRTSKKNCEKRKDFFSLLDEVINGKVERIVITYKDRLSRIGFNSSQRAALPLLSKNFESIYTSAIKYLLHPRYRDRLRRRHRRRDYLHHQKNFHF